MGEIIVACSGTYDGVIHPGHMNFLRRASEYGALYAFIVDDWVVQKNKNRTPMNSLEERIRNVKATGLVHDALPLLGKTDEENKQTILNFKPNVYCVGEDQLIEWTVALIRELIPLGTQIKNIPDYKPEIYTTTKLYFDK